MDKNALLRDIRAGHASIANALAALDDEALLDPAPGMEGWTRKDVVAHIEWWHEHTSNVVEGTRTGVDPYPGDDEPWDPDAWNARILAENRDRTAADVRAGEAASYERLLGLVEAAGRGRAVQRGPAAVAGWDARRDGDRRLIGPLSRAHPAPRLRRVASEDAAPPDAAGPRQVTGRCEGLSPDRPSPTGLRARCRVLGRINGRAEGSCDPLSGASVGQGQVQVRQVIRPRERTSAGTDRRPGAADRGWAAGYPSSSRFASEASIVLRPTCTSLKATCTSSSSRVSFDVITIPSPHRACRTRSPSR